MGKYNVAVAAATNFSCVGCTDFADYLTKVGIATFKADGTTCAASDTGALVALDSLLTMYNATSTTQTTLKTNFNSMYKKTVSGSTSAFFETICTEQFSTDAWIGKVTLPYMVGSNATNINIILPGTTPCFSTVRRNLTSSGSYTITRTATSLNLCGTTLSKSNFADGVIPLRLIVCLQGAGGGGGGNGEFQSGTGGGGGGYIAGVINLAKYSTWNVKVGAGGAGGEASALLDGSIGKGTAGGLTSVTPTTDTNDNGLQANGGGAGASDKADVTGSGGGSAIRGSGTSTWRLGYKTGGSGGDVAKNGSDVSGLTIYSMNTMRTSYSNTSKTYSAKTGGGNSGYGGGGGASLCANGGASQANGSNGSGGGGADFHLFDAKSGWKGGTGSALIYY